MIDVACAIIVSPSNQVLVTQRSAEMKHPMKIEFPGGKVEPGESPSECVVREIKEELNLEIYPVFEMSPQVYSYPEITVRLMPFVCHVVAGEIKLREHCSYAWVTPEALLDLDWLDADVSVMKHYLSLQ